MNVFPWRHGRLTGRRRPQARAIVVCLTPALAAVTLLAPTPAGASAVYHVTDNVSLRTAPTAAPTGVYGIPKGAAFTVQCQTIGQPVGPHGNTLYFLASYGGRSMYIPDTYTDSPHLAGQPPIAGIPMCGGGSPAPPASNMGVWVGSPVEGTWGLGGDPSTTPAGGHHRLVKASPQNDFAVDLTRTGQQGAYLYVAAANGAYDSRVSTVVTQIIDDGACRAGGGGDMVTVAIRFDGATVGQVTFAHLDRNPALAVGRPVSRWGTYLGTTAVLRGSATGGSGCWTGPHAHTELRASTRYACWNRTFGVGQAVHRSNFIGFVSGPDLVGYSRGCP